MARVPGRARDPEKTREEILAAARVRFSQQSYGNVGVRQIAGDVGVDAALVNHYFGTKQALFGEVIRGGFHVEDHLPKKLSELGVHLATEVLSDDSPAPVFNGLHLLLRSMGDPDIASMVSERFHIEFVDALARRLGGTQTRMRAAVIASYVIGLATMRHGLASPPLRSAESLRRAGQLVAEAIQACAEGA